MPSIDLLRHPSRWGLRARSALTAAAVVTVVVVFGAIVMLTLLNRALYGAADSYALGRISEISDRLHSAAPADLPADLLAPDSHVEIVQILDPSGAPIRSTTGAPSGPLITVPDSGTVTGIRAEPDLRVSARRTHGPAPATVLVAVSVDPADDVLKALVAGLALSGPIVVAAAAAATYRLVGRSLSSVEAIRSRVADIGASQLSQRVPIPAAADEIARLATTMNGMLARIEAGHAAQRRFLADASHELRSPLSTVIAGLELARDHPETVDTAMIESTLLPEAMRMKNLVDDLLTLAAADDHLLTLHRTDVDLDDIAATVLDLVRHTTTVELSGQLAPARISGDPGALTRVVRNLVDNAVIHARSTVTVRTVQGAADARVIVDDDGPGIPATDRSRVFDRFVRLADDRARATGGAGLGMPIVAEIVAAHHGTVRIDDSPLGGARLTVTLPVAG
ncbi:sensor histidine kinase [Nocardia aurantia]|uniref:histidine kinase n=1 Tax=Nocardia aurantia TaxID=2585199 RepID=A0A7K0DLV7_9NOCA|nr:ATP-binding protein [Nocardia aurantia]MQY26750.1 Adaptive-response sensory-kinase SasA [Nocardia aurantia]